MGNQLFRTNLLGGYNKEDVKLYIARLEEGMASLQAQLEAWNHSQEDGKAEQTMQEVEDVVVLGDFPENSLVIPKSPDAVASTGTGTGTGALFAQQKENGSEISANLKSEFAEAEKELKKTKKELEETKTELERVKNALIDARIDAEVNRRLYNQCLKGTSSPPHQDCSGKQSGAEANAPLLAARRL